MESNKAYKKFSKCLFLTVLNINKIVVSFKTTQRKVVWLSAVVIVMQTT